MRLAALLSLAALSASCHLGPPPPDPLLDRAALDRGVERAMRSGEDTASFSVWLGSLDGGEWYSFQAEAWRPAASSIKTAYLVELFAEYAGRLDEPLPGLEVVWEDPEHPAWAHFDAEVRAEIRSELEGLDARRIADAMVHGEGVSNAVYNAAANAVTTVLGGPEALTERIRARDPGFRGFAVRRYMLAARDVTGDNELRAASLASMLSQLATFELEGVDEATVEAMREVLFLEDTPEAGRHFYKGGSLSSDPQCRIRAGWHELGAATGRHGFVYVVIGEQPDPGTRERARAFEELEQAVDQLTLLVRLQGDRAARRSR